MTGEFLGVLRLTESLGQAISSELTLIFFALTAVVFLLFVVLLYRAGRVHVRVREMVAHYTSRATRREKDRIPMALGRKDHVGELIASCIEEFDKRLVLHSDKAIHRGLSGQDVLDSERIIHEVDLLGIPYDIVRLGPAVLTALGLLGTFFGITDGLGAIGDIQVQGADAILPIISDVVKGLATAFWTSIVGVVSGVIIMWWSRTTEHRLDIAVEKAVEDLDQLFVLITPEQLASLELRKLEQQTAHLDGLVGESRSGNQSLARIESQLERAASASENLVKHMRRLTEDSEESRSLLQQLIDDLGKTFTAAFENTMTPQLERMVAAISDQVSQVGTAGSDTARQFAEELVTTVSQNLTQTFTSMASSVTGFQSGFEQMMGRVEQSVASQAAVVQIGLDATRLAQEAAATTGSEMQRVQSAISDTAGVVASLANLGGDFQELITGVERAGSSYQAAAANLGGFSERFAEQAARLSNTVVNLGTIITEGTNRLERTLGKLDVRLDAERELADRYAAVGSAFQTVLQRAAPTIEHLKTSAQSLAQISTSFQGIVTTLDGAPERVEQATQALGQSATQLLQAADAVSSVSESMETWRDDATTAINEFNAGLTTSIRDSLTSYDASLSHAVASLSAAFDELEEILNELPTRRGDNAQPAAE